MATKEELLGLMKDGVINYNEDQVKEAANQWLQDGYVALEGIMDGLAYGMEVVGQLYERNEYFVPEVLMCADAL
jgi:methanogenic corrinoid protein MtbC1